MVAVVSSRPVQFIRLRIEYDGTDFHGWQIQPSDRTVQGELQLALQKMTGVATVIRGASRTDAGVHAEGQVAHFETNSNIRPEQFAKGMTAHSGWDVAVVESSLTDADFSARYDARGKIYRYSIWNGKAPSPIRRRTSWHIRGDLDLDAMRDGAAHLVGRRDFAAFRAAGCDQPTTIREMQRVEIIGERHEIIEIIVEGTAFLQHMVRIMVGTLIEVGLGRIDADEVARIRDSLDRKNAARTAPPQGLCLMQVQY